MENEPLLNSASGGAAEAANGSASMTENSWRWSYEQVRKHPSLRSSAASDAARTDDLQLLTADDLLSASTFYPPSLHAALLDPQLSISSDLSIASQGGHDHHLPGYTSAGLSRNPYDEVEIRQLLLSHVKKHCCWGRFPARKWKITAIDNCNVYVGTLETFIEEREMQQVLEPHKGRTTEGKDKTLSVGLWELDLRMEFPTLFVPIKETSIKVPHSDTIQKCLECESKGKVFCPTCNARGVYNERRVFQCVSCHGRGLIAHRDGSDTICTTCKGKGTVPCRTCGSEGVVDCKTCDGHGSLLKYSVASVRWRTLSVRDVKLTNHGAASVPQEVIKRAKGVQLCNVQAYQCAPAFFADSYDLNRFSSEIIARRAPIPAAARVVSERHIISVVPVTRVTMEQGSRSFSFYIIGDNMEIYLPDYPSKFSGWCCF